MDGDIRIDPGFLSRYLDLFQGDVYNEKKLKTMGDRLRELPFLRESSPAEIKFSPYDTRLQLHLEEKKANQLNGLIGLLPNTQETGKFLVTIDALIALQNALGHGETMGLTFQNLQAKSPRLKVDFTYPYLLGTLIGADLHFDLYKKGEEFLRTTLQAGGRYQFTATDYLRIYYENQGNTIITVDTAFLLAFKKLPNQADVRANGAGTELVVNKTDYRLNPRKGPGSAPEHNCAAAQGAPQRQDYGPARRDRF